MTASVGYHHIPVMVREVVQYLNCSPGKVYVDCTLGGGGHTRAILQSVGGNCQLIGIDRDPDSIANARQVFSESILNVSHNVKLNVKLVNDNFTGLSQILRDLCIGGVDGIIVDLGFSLYQIQGSGRGFSFLRDEPLDMRMDPQEGITAEALVNELPEAELARLIYLYGEERWSRRVARTIVQERDKAPIRSSAHLAEVVTRSIPARFRPGRIHPATRTFQALRIAVNRELACLEAFLNSVYELLNPGGRLCILSFHSLEDRIVKDFFRMMSRGCVCPPGFPICTCGKRPRMCTLTKKPVTPGPAEVAENPMARSTKLRAAEKLLADSPLGDCPVEEHL